MSIAEMTATVARLSGGPAKEVVDLAERGGLWAHEPSLEPVCMLFDTETTGTGINSVCWQIGTVKLYRGRSNDKLFAAYNEIVLPYLPSDLPRKAFNSGTMHAAMEYDRDEAADYARDMMYGDYDPDEFKDHMRDRLKEVLLERLEDFFGDWSECPVKVAYNLSFDIGVVDRLYDEYAFDLISDHPDDTEDTKYCAYQTFKKDHPNVRPTKLPHACAHYGISMNAASAHTALYDATCLMKLWVNMGYV